MSTRSTTKFLAICVTLALAASMAATQAQAQLTFTTVDVPGAMETDINDINTAGTLVGTYCTGDICPATGTGTPQAFMKLNGKLKKITVPNSTGSYAYGINDAGDVVGWYVDQSGITHGYLLKSGKFTKIDPPGSTLTNAWGINTAGVIVGTYIGTDGVYHGFVDNAGTYTTFDAPNGSLLTQLTGVNNKNQMVGIYFDPSSVQHGFTLAGTKFTSFDFPGASVTAGDKISDLGEIVGLHGTSSSGPFSGYTKKGPTYADVAAPNSTETRVRGLNNAGVITGRYTDSSGKIHGFTAQ